MATPMTGLLAMAILMALLLPPFQVGFTFFPLPLQLSSAKRSKPSLLCRLHNPRFSFNPCFLIADLATACSVQAAFEASIVPVAPGAQQEAQQQQQQQQGEGAAFKIEVPMDQPPATADQDDDDDDEDESKE